MSEYFVQNALSLFSYSMLDVWIMTSPGFAFVLRDLDSLLYHFVISLCSNLMNALK